MNEPDWSPTESNYEMTKPEIDHTMTKQTKYLKKLFGKSSSGQTAIVYILSARTNVELGKIKWFGQWRQYAFYPSTDKVTIFNVECMNDITVVINKLMDERKVQKPTSVRTIP